MTPNKNVLHFKKEKTFIPFVMCTHITDDPVVPDKRFASTDNPETFEKNKKLRGKNWHYFSKEIYYNTNSNGYRNKEWDKVNWQHSIVVLGCSMTTGIGVAEDETITHYLSKLTGRDVVNLGLPGAGNDAILFNNLVLKRDFPKPYAVVNLWSCNDRLVEFADSQTLFHGAWSRTSNYWAGHQKYKTNPIVKDMFYYDIAKQFWKDTNYYQASFYPDTARYAQCDKLEFENTARDLLHCGRDDNKANAEKIFTNLTRHKNKKKV